MKVAAAYPDVNVFKNLFDVLSKTVDEVCLVFTAEGMRVKAMDPANVALLDVLFPRDAFVEYEVEGEARIGLNLNVIMKLLKRGKRGDRIDIKADDESVEITITGVVKRTYKLRNLEVATPEIPEAQLIFDTAVTILVDPLKEALRDIEIVGTQAIFEYKEDEEALIISSPGETKYTMKLSRASGAVIDIESSKPSKSVYSVDYLLNTLSLVKVADTVKIEFSTQMPLRLRFDLPAGGTAVYLLAPAAT